MAPVTQHLPIIGYAMIAGRTNHMTPQTSYQLGQSLVWALRVGSYRLPKERNGWNLLVTLSLYQHQLSVGNKKAATFPLKKKNQHSSEFPMM